MIFQILALSSAFGAPTNLPLMPVSNQFQYTVTTDGKVSGPGISLKSQDGASSYYRSDSISTNAVKEQNVGDGSSNSSTLEPGQGLGSIEVITNNGKSPKTVISRDSGIYFMRGLKHLERTQLSVVQLGANAKVLSHTQCWDNTQCFTLTPDFCSTIAEKLGAKSLTQAMDDAKACVKMSVAFDKSLHLQSKDYYKAHHDNLEVLANSQTVNIDKSTFKAFWDKHKPKIGRSTSPYKDLIDVDTVETHPMRMYEMLMTCEHYERADAFPTTSTRKDSPDKKLDGSQ